jgi:hypothetical protein
MADAGAAVLLESLSLAGESAQDNNTDNNHNDDKNNDGEVRPSVAANGDNENGPQLTVEESRALAARIGGFGSETETDVVASGGALEALRDLLRHGVRTVVLEMYERFPARLAMLFLAKTSVGSSEEDSLLFTQCLRGLLSVEDSPPIREVIGAGAVPVLLAHTKSENELLAFGSLVFSCALSPHRRFSLTPFCDSPSDDERIFVDNYQRCFGNERRHTCSNRERGHRAPRSPPHRGQPEAARAGMLGPWQHCWRL